MMADRESERLLQAVVEINNRIMGLVLAVVSGIGLFAATLWLVVKGGPVVGPHLSLLAQFFPGYSVTYFGSVVGLVYGFIVGYVGGWSVAWLYNRFVDMRSR
jgi:hypothetical protein